MKPKRKDVLKPDWLVITKPVYNKEKKAWEFLYQPDNREEKKTKPQKFTYGTRKLAFEEYRKIIKAEQAKKTKIAEEVKKEISNKNITPVKGKYNENHLPEEKAIERRGEILSMIVDGCKFHEITKTLVQGYKMKVQSAHKEIYRAYRIIHSFSAQHYEDIVELHLNRYEEFYRIFRKEGIPRLAMRALRYKEELQGIHNDIVSIQINNFEKEQEGDGITYHYDLLNEKEASKMNSFINKIKF